MLYPNPNRDESYAAAPVSEAPLAFHRQLPGYHVTRIVELDGLVSELGLHRLLIKDESYRLGLPAFKILGVAWATYRALCAHLERSPESVGSLGALRAACRDGQSPTLLTATDGNHGRAVARVARWLGLQARILVPRQIPPDRIAAIQSERAEVVVVDGSYDAAVEEAAGLAGDELLLISDTAAEPHEVIPGWIVEGYSTMFREIDSQLLNLDESVPDIVFVQIGVGSLAGAAVAHYRRDDRSRRPLLIGVEPESAACVLASARAGRPAVVAGPHDSVMDCLNAGKPSAASIDAVLRGFDGFLALPDARVPEAVDALSQHGVLAGPTGAAGLLGLFESADDLELADKTVLLINTEGLADRAGYLAAMSAATVSPSRA